MPYEIDYASAESENYSSKIVLDDRIFYVKLFASPVGYAKYFYAEQNGRLQKEISKLEFDVWLTILTDSDETEIKAIIEKINQGKKY